MKEKCSLLERYFVPKDSSSKEEWQKNVCLTYCPLKDACVYDYRGKVPRIVRETLKKAKIPCPKCGARDKWEVYEDDGIHCIHCGKIIPREKPSELKKARRVR